MCKDLVLYVLGKRYLIGVLFFFILVNLYAYDMLPNVNCYGGNITQEAYTTPDPSNCSFICDSDVNCIGFAFDYSSINQNCWIKWRCSERNRTLGIHLYLKAGMIVVLYSTHSEEYSSV